MGAIAGGGGDLTQFFAIVGALSGVVAVITLGMGLGKMQSRLDELQRQVDERATKDEFLGLKGSLGELRADVSRILDLLLAATRRERR